jgi:hypothetical protein
MNELEDNENYIIPVLSNIAETITSRWKVLDM